MNVEIPGRVSSKLERMFPPLRIYDFISAVLILNKEYREKLADNDGIEILLTREALIFFCATSERGAQKKRKETSLTLFT